jgi:hypothetical protein
VSRVFYYILFFEREITACLSIGEKAPVERDKLVMWEM